MKNIIGRIAGYNLDRSINELNSLNGLSKKDYLDQQQKKRDNIFRYHYSYTPWFRNYVGKNPDMSWEDVPIITKSNLQEYSSQIHSNFSRLNLYYANTSGSSGHPLSFWKDKYCHSMSWASIHNSYLKLGITSFHNEARFFGNIKGSLKNKIFEYLKDRLLRRYRFNVFNITDDEFIKYLDIFKHKTFNYIYGYTNVVLEFSKFLIKEKIALIDYCPSLKCCIVTAEMCSSKDRKIINQALGIPVYNEYGASEVSVIAIEDKNYKWWLSSERLWIEILNEQNNPVKEGELGKIIITDLYNRAFPFIRYEIGDLGSMQSDNKYPFLTLKELLGRESDTIYLPSGKKAPGLTFYYITRSILEKSSSIKKFIIIQKTINTFTFQIVSKIDLARPLKQAIISETTRYLESGLNIEFEIVEQIRMEYSDKIKHFFSELNY